MKQKKTLLACIIGLASNIPATSFADIKFSVYGENIVISDVFMQCPDGTEVMSEEFAKNNLSEMYAYMGYDKTAVIASGKVVSTINHETPKIESAQGTQNHHTLCVSNGALPKSDRQFFVHNRESDNMICPSGSRLIGMDLAKINKTHLARTFLGQWGFAKIDAHNILTGWGYDAEIKNGDNPIAICVKHISNENSEKIPNANFIVDDVQLFPHTDPSNKVNITANGNVQFSVKIKVKLVDENHIPITTPFDDYMYAKDINGKLINFIRLYEGVLYDPNNESEIAIDGKAHTSPNKQWVASRTQNEFIKRNGQYSVTAGDQNLLSIDDINDGYHLFELFVSTTDLTTSGETGQICARVGNEIPGQTWDTCAEGRNEYVEVNTVAPYSYDISDFEITNSWPYRSRHERVWVEKIILEARNGIKLSRFDIETVGSGSNYNNAHDSRADGIAYVGKFVKPHKNQWVGKDQLTGVSLAVATKYDENSVFNSWDLKGYSYWYKKFMTLTDLDYNPSINGLTFFNFVFNKYRIVYGTYKGWKFTPGVYIKPDFNLNEYDVPPQVGKIKGYDVYGDSFDIIFSYDKKNELFKIQNIR